MYLIPKNYALKDRKMINSIFCVFYHNKIAWKINSAKYWFFEKNNKIDKLMAKLMSKLCIIHTVSIKRKHSTKDCPYKKVKIFYAWC